MIRARVRKAVSNSCKTKHVTLANQHTLVPFLHVHVLAPTHHTHADLAKTKQQVEALEKALATAQAKNTAHAQANASIGPAALALTAGAASGSPGGAAGGAAVGAAMTTDVLDRFLKTENELTVERGERRRLELYLSQVLSLNE